MQEKMAEAQALMDRFAEANRIIEKYDRSASKLIPILQQIQAKYNYLSEEMICFVADSLNLPASHVYGVATFYAHFSLSPKGKHIFKLCDGTACHVKKAQEVLSALREKLKLAEGKNTTDDLMFTVEIVSCLGACGLAPVVVADETVHGQMTADRVDKIIDDIVAGDKNGKSEEKK